MSSKNIFLGPLGWWAYASIVATALCVLVYGAVQQSFRASANDPQIQMAQDIATKLTQSAALLDMVPAEDISIEKSLSPFIVLYDTEGNPIVGNGYLGGELLTVPKGVFDSAQKEGENKLTLEPASGVRIAAVVVPFVGREANGYVLAGRSLRETEARIENLIHMVEFTWVATVGFLLVISLFLGRIYRHRE